MVAQSWRSWIGAPAEGLSDLTRLGDEKVGDLSRNVERAGAALQEPQSESLAEAKLLLRRLVALGLDPYELALSDPDLVRHLVSSCKRCESPARCMLEFTREPTDPVRQEWREYCPNAATLNMLSVLQACAKTGKQHPIRIDR
jgi:hypothetical protein